MSSLPCPTLHGRTRSLLASLLIGATGAAQAFDTNGAGDAPPSPLHLEWTQATGSTTPAAAPAPYGPATVYGTPTQTMLWASRGRLAVGFGVEQRGAAPPGYPPSATPGLAGEREGQWLLGVSLRTSLQTRLVWQMPTAAPTAAGLPAGTSADGLSAPRVSLNWGHPDPYKGLLRGSLRFELARDTTVSIKPKGGNWSVALSSKW